MVLAAIDLVVTLVRKDSPYGLRVVGAIVGVVCMVMMGVAYTDVYGIAVWCDAPATILAFLAGDLAMGLALFAVLGSEDYDGAVLRIVSFVVNAALAVGLVLEAVAFSNEGFDPASQIAALVIAPIASAALVALSPRIANKRAVAVAICVVAVVGVGISRYAFYATCTVA